MLSSQRRWIGPEQSLPGPPVRGHRSGMPPPPFWMESDVPVLFQLPASHEQEFFKTKCKRFSPSSTNYIRFSRGSAQHPHCTLLLPPKVTPCLPSGTGLAPGLLPRSLGTQLSRSSRSLSAHVWCRHSAGPGAGDTVVPTFQRNEVSRKRPFFIIP